jgi:hypothetical protein
MTVFAQDELVIVREWGSDAFHQRVIDLEREGYVTREGSYNIAPEVNPETGAIIHLHTIEMFRLPPDDRLEG